jgi:hypothetical protein
MRTATVTFVIAAMFSITAVAQDLTSWYQVQGGEWQVPVNIASEAASRIQAAG